MNLQRFPTHDTSAAALQNGVYQWYHRKQCALIRVPFCRERNIGNICKWLGNVAVNGSAVYPWAKRVTDGELGKAQLLCVLQQLEMWWWQCSGTLKEWFSLMWCREERKLTLKKLRKHLLCIRPDKILCSMLLKRDNTASHQRQDGGSHHTIWMDNVTASIVQGQA